jgi:predicted nuclease of restriction endonuclease-like (RecB) superfamily
MLINDNQYLSVVVDIKEKIKQARYKATFAINQELIMLYYQIGKIINEHKSWGNKFVDNLARDIKLEYPDSTGYSVRNLKYMAKFALEYPDEQFVQTLSAQIPWSHKCSLRMTSRNIQTLLPQHCRFVILSGNESEGSHR